MLLRFGPLVALAEVQALEQQLLAGVAEHVRVQQPQRGELLPGVARDLVEQAALAVDHLVVRKRQHEVLVERVQQAERQLVVVPAAVDRLLRRCTPACRASSPCSTSG